MKTRDELAETFVVSVLRTFGPDDSAEWEAVVKDGFNLADAFVAERERRAAKIENRVGHSVDEATLRLDYDQANVIALALGYDASALPLGQAIEKIKELASRSPVETPAAEALKFNGTYLVDTKGRRLYVGPPWYDSYDAVLTDDRQGGDNVAHVRIRATDRAHAERIVAAMLPVGRGTK